MRTTLQIVVAVAVASCAPAAARAQVYQRHWNTVVVAPASPVSAVTTGALPPGQAKPATALKPVAGGPVRHMLEGIASYYWQGQKTASGEKFDPQALTAAHRTLPMNTRVKVTHVESGKSVEVRINDRGPFKPGRVVDLSDRAAEILGFKSRGLAHVKMEVLP